MIFLLSARRSLWNLLVASWYLFNRPSSICREDVDVVVVFLCCQRFGTTVLAADSPLISKGQLQGHCHEYGTTAMRYSVPIVNGLSSKTRSYRRCNVDLEACILHPNDLFKMLQKYYSKQFEYPLVQKFAGIFQLQQVSTHIDPHMAKD